MTTKFELFSKNKINNIYLTESMRKDWLHMLYDYWDEKDTPYPDDYYFWTNLLYQYFNELSLGEAIEQQRLTPKYDIMRSLVPLVKKYFVTTEEDNTLFKITC